MHTAAKKRRTARPTERASASSCDSAAPDTETARQHGLHQSGQCFLEFPGLPGYLPVSAEDYELEITANESLQLQQNPQGDES